MKILEQYIVKYDNSHEKDKNALLYYCATGWFINYLHTDMSGGWSMRLESIKELDAKELINKSSF